MKDNQKNIRSARDAVRMMLRAYWKAQQTIVEGATAERLFDVGTTTMLGAVVMQLETPKGYDTMFLCVSLGDCKAYHITGSGSVTEVTSGNRNNISDAKDPGGRLGPQLEDGSPDLRNLSAFWYPCKENDIIFIVTDGVSDNLGIIDRILCANKWF